MYKVTDTMYIAIKKPLHVYVRENLLVAVNSIAFFN